MKNFKNIAEQHREKGRFKPVKPHDVPNVAVVSPRPSSDSANVKLKEDLRRWFSKSDPKGDWKRINSKGEAIGPCAREPGEPKPKCMSKGQRAALSKKERASAVRRKREQDPNPERQGAPINVKSKVNENMEQLDEKNKPTNPELWSRAIAQARAKFDVYPSAYANGWASKWYKEHGGGWKSVKEEVQQEGAVPSTEKVITVKHKTSGKTLRVSSHAAEKYKKIGYHPVNEEVVMEREDDEYHTPSKHYVRVQVSKGDGPKTHFKATVRAKEPQHAVSAAIAHYKQKGYTVHDHKYLGEEVEIEEACSCESTCNKTPKGENCPTHGMKDCSIKEATKDQDPPFDPDPPKKKSVVPGKYGSGYSTARHLARQALQKQAEKFKPTKNSLEESRKTEIVKEIIKKKKAKSEDAFQSEPELSSTLTKV